MDLTNVLCHRSHTDLSNVYPFPWTHLLDSAKVDLLVLNMGAHVHSECFYKRLLDPTVRFLKANYKGRIIYRTTVTGHHNCDQSHEPYGRSHRQCNDFRR